MASYNFNVLYKNIETVALFLNIYDNFNIFEMNDIKSMFPKNPPLVVDYMIHLIKKGNRDKDDILEKLKPLLINWLNPRNGTYVRENNTFTPPQDKYVLKVINMISDNIYVQYPN